MKTKQWMIIAFFSAIPFFSLPLKAQVTVGELDKPNPDAVLDVRSKGKLGLLLPQVELFSTDQARPMTSKVVGMIVYNTKTVNDVVPGFYYNDGDKWVKLGATAVGKIYTAANGLTLSDTEFQLGGALTRNTTISAAGADTLIISAPLAITSGNPGDGYVLTSDSIGNTSWLSLPKLIEKKFIISPVETGDVHVTNEDLVLVDPDNTTHTLSLPATATVGRLVYVVNVGQKAINLSPLPVNKTYQAIDAGFAFMFIYAGNNQWYCVSGL